MNYVNRSKLQSIYMLERVILTCERYNSIWLAVNLRELRDMRKDLYATLTYETQQNEELKSELLDEYTEHCNFTFKLLTRKKLSNAIFETILHTFLSDYDFIEQSDEDKTAYKLTLQTLNNLKATLRSSDVKMSNYRLRGLNLLSKNFVENNKQDHEYKL